MRIYAKIVGDLMHLGHVRFFQAAQSLGSHLTVCIVPDERAARWKRPPIMTTAERMEVVASCRYVDAVICDGPKATTLAFMRERGFQIYAFGAKDDAELREKLADCPDLPEDMRRRIGYTHGISSSDIISRIRSRFDAAFVG